ncbi:exosortase B [Methylophaga sp.]|uniref:exosortase B n=1 Tax=Methylophaga sp. TaxID=2024840 RepID=UPI0013FF22D1|nr:exosortase B [Methylophaga sp.]MTI62588.1 exosortase B [Methylophaga sp.]
MTTRLFSFQQDNENLKWIFIIFGLFAMYLPTFLNLSDRLWQSEEHAHGPFVLLITLFLFWQQRDALLTKQDERPYPVLGSVIFALGLLIYLLGRSQDILIFDVGSMVPVVIGLLLMTKGFKTLLSLWFPIFFLLFLLPIPGFIIDAVTLPMKIAVSYVAESILYWFDYPVARNGVVLYVGPYQLLVADACAGLQTLISLEALGLLYLHLVKHDSFLRNCLLALAIIPISFTANVTRVLALILVTYYFGDEVGQSYLHDFAGLFLFIVALTLIISVDTLLSKYLRDAK